MILGNTSIAKLPYGLLTIVGVAICFGLVPIAVYVYLVIQGHNQSVAELEQRMPVIFVYLLICFCILCVPELMGRLSLMHRVVAWFFIGAFAFPFMSIPPLWVLFGEKISSYILQVVSVIAIYFVNIAYMFVAEEFFRNKSIPSKGYLFLLCLGYSMNVVYFSLLFKFGSIGLITAAYLFGVTTFNVMIQNFHKNPELKYSRTPSAQLPDAQQG